MTKRLREFLLPSAADDATVAAAPPVAIREIFRRFWPDARPYRWGFALGLLLVVLVPLLEGAAIWLFKVVVDRVLVPRHFGAFPPIAAAYVGLTALTALVTFADDYVSDWIGERFLLSLRVRLFAHLQRLSLDVLDRRRLGDLIARLTGDIAAIESFVLTGVADFLNYMARIAIFGGALFLLSWRLALVALVASPLFWLAARSFGGRIKRASREKRRRSGSLTSLAEESLANAALVQAYDRGEAEVERFRREGEGVFAAQMASTRLSALFSPVVDFVELVGALVVIGVATYELSRGRLTLGGLLAFLGYMTQLYNPLRGLSRLSNSLYSASAGAERVIELLEEAPTVRDAPRPRPLVRARGELGFEEVAFAYEGTTTPALSGVTLRVGPGETLALLGASGSGKSTLAKLAVRLYDPGSGSVRLDGIDLRELRIRDLRANVALVLQETLIFHDSVRENIRWGRPGARDEEIMAAARAADAHEFITQLPDGYDTIVGQRGRRLSGGQRQRLAIARALIRDPAVLVLDEPTTGLDPESARRVLEPLRRLMAGRTTIIVSHDLAVVREATQIAVLDAGRVTELGTHEDLVDLGGDYARLQALHRGELVAG